MQQQSTLLPFVLNSKASEVKDERANGGVAEASRDPSTRAVSLVEVRRVPGSYLDSMYTVPCAQLREDELLRHRRELTMTPLDTGFSGQPPPSFDAYECGAGVLRVPRFYGVAQWGMPSDVRLCDGVEMDVAFEGTLNPLQTEATAQVLSVLSAPPHGTIMVLPCGYGKTVCALYLAHKLRRRTLVLVHKGFLVSQWHERAAAFLPSATRGKIQQNVVDADADIVIGMVQSISKREYPARILSTFGTVIIDEAHHMAASVFSRALRCLPAKNIIGLSATPDRKDNLTCLLHHSMGQIGYRIERKPEHTLVSCLLYEGGKRKEIMTRDGRISMPSMLNMLASDPLRNECIADHMARLFHANRCMIVLTDRISQLKALLELLIAREVPSSDISFYIGTTPAAERDRASQRRIILSTYCMAKEGLDIPRLDTLILATPKGDIVQASGRVQRKHPDKNVPLIVDVVDTFSVFERLRWKRWSYYRNEKFVCQTFGISNADAEWYA